MCILIWHLLFYGTTYVRERQIQLICRWDHIPPISFIMLNVKDNTSPITLFPNSTRCNMNLNRPKLPTNLKLKSITLLLDIKIFWFCSNYPLCYLAKYSETRSFAFRKDKGTLTLGILQTMLQTFRKVNVHFCSIILNDHEVVVYVYLY